METLEDIKKAIMVDPQNQVYTERGIEPLFAAPKSARINIVGQAPGIKAQEHVYIGMIRVVIVCVNGWVLTMIHFIILAILLRFRWTFIFQGMENQVICHLARVLLKNGINRF